MHSEAFAQLICYKKPWPLIQLVVLSDSLKLPRSSSNCRNLDYTYRLTHEGRFIFAAL